MEAEEQQMKSDPRTKFTLENCLRMGFHPKGYRGFMEGVNYDLELGPIQSSINRVLGTSFDIFKYILYATTVGKVAYEILK